jgi:hypothetical protein
MKKAYLFLALTVSACWALPALAQSAVGGPSKPRNQLGGSTTHTNPVVPVQRGNTVPVQHGSTTGIAVSTTKASKK